MNLARIDRLARLGTLKVEDILVAAKEGVPGLAAELRSLSQQLNWSISGFDAHGHRVVPLAKWADVAILYSSGGIAALKEMLQDRANFPFIIGLLEELQTGEALLALISFYADVFAMPQRDAEIAWSIATALNSMLYFKDAVPASEQECVTIRDFLYSLYPLASNECERALAVLVFRGVGDQKSLEFVKTVKDFQRHWDGTKGVTLQAIRNRLRNRGKYS